MASVRFTGTSTPFSFSVAIQLSSRVFLIFRAIFSAAACQLISSQ